MTNDEFSKVEIFSKKIRRNILDMAFFAGASSSHFGGALSIVEIISVLFGKKMKISDDPQWQDRDRFILSKGHACLAYYAALCELGYIQKEELKTSTLLGIAFDCGFNSKATFNRAFKKSTDLSPKDYLKNV